jgi:hypothetical protein
VLDLGCDQRVGHEGQQVGLCLQSGENLGKGGWGKRGTGARIEATDMHAGGTIAACPRRTDQCGDCSGASPGTVE